MNKLVNKQKQKNIQPINFTMTIRIPYLPISYTAQIMIHSFCNK